MVWPKARLVEIYFVVAVHHRPQPGTHIVNFDKHSAANYPDTMSRDVPFTQDRLRNSFETVNDSCVARLPPEPIDGTGGEKE